MNLGFRLGAVECRSRLLISRRSCLSLSLSNTLLPLKNTRLAKGSIVPMLTMACLLCPRMWLTTELAAKRVRRIHVRIAAHSVMKVIVPRMRFSKQFSSMLFEKVGRDVTIAERWSSDEMDVII